MNSKIFLILFILLPVLAEAQSPAINGFYRKHKKEKGTINATLPGWLIKLGVGIARPFVEDEEARMALKLARKFGKTKFLVSEDDCRITQGQYLQLITEVKAEGYEMLLQVRDEGENVTIMSREKKGKIRRVLIVVREDDSFVLFSAKTKIEMSDINDLIREYNKEEKEEDSIITLSGTNT